MKKIEETSGVNILEEMANFTFTSKYAKYDEDLKRRETWFETVDRVLNMHLKRFKFLPKEDKDEIRWAFKLVKEKRVVPSMRSLQFGGKPIEAHSLRTFNCSVRHIDSLRSFAESFYALLCGTGVGFGISKKYLHRLPNLISKKDIDEDEPTFTYVIHDSIEGWADSVEVLLMTYFNNTPFSGREVFFDYSHIRRKGSPLKTGGGKAPGYKGLKNAHLKIKKLLKHLVSENYERLRTIDAYDILMHTADAVLSGGIRRSACSVIFDKDDELMMSSKTGNWYEVNPQRARSNNSFKIIREKATLEDIKKAIEHTKQFGEPGFVFCNESVSEDILFNPCFTKDTRILTDLGWKSFGDLLGSSPVIIQDKRVNGYIENGVEKWDINLKEKGCVKNKAESVFLTQKDQKVYSLTTICGRSVKATANHHFATRRGMVELKDLNIGDEILIPIPELHKTNFDSLDYKEGVYLGMLYGDGTLTSHGPRIDLWGASEEDVLLFEKIAKEIIELNAFDGVSILARKEPKFTNPNTAESIGNKPKRSMISAILKQLLEKYSFDKDDFSWLLPLSKDLKAGFLFGAFYSDGHYDYNDSSRSHSCRISSSRLKSLSDLMLICQELGVFSKIYNGHNEGNRLLPNSKREKVEYYCKKNYRLCITSSENSKNFFDLIGKYGEKYEKFKKLYSKVKRTNYYRPFSKITNIQFDSVQDVYCLKEDNRRTLIAEGFTARRCFEISFVPVTPYKETGFQMCNLSSINGAKIQSIDDFAECSKAASIIGTLQAAYTNFNYLNPFAKQLSDEEALLGVSITGIMDNPDILLDKNNQIKCAKIAVDTNKIWAEKIGINPASRVTCVKPEGTSSIVLESASGIHPHHARKYFRRIQVNKLDNIYKFFKEFNPHASEESVWSANKTDDVITFPVEVSEKSLIKKDLTAIKHLEIIKNTQINWVETGTSDTNRKDVAHNTSCTVLVGDDEWDAVAEYLFNNREHFTAISLLPKTGDKIYQQAPMEEVVTKEDEDKFNKLLENWRKIDYTLLKEYDDKTSQMSEVACAGGACEITRL